ncbi:hypothetical protein GR183_21605 [Stappia sp. GBMRC 2046]|uniref:Type III restriction enzyme, res subunit n=1 Tax=Stappia sediminis TaxID=2692190 RepID=A0A7X3LYL0_9HYPH|nr:DEAD/DEAH box helicase family protein [Stappia sediminis]MXN67509.1 hypothetical protein [Stappia sediminis]
MNCYYFDALCGAGKTHAVAKYAVRCASRGANVLFVQPTKNLIAATLANELADIPDTVHVKAIHGDNSKRVLADIVNYFRNPDPDDRPNGQILLISHKAFLDVPYLQNRQDWILLMDEVPQADVFEELSLPETYDLLTAHLEIDRSGPSYGMLTARPPECRGAMSLNKIARNKNNDDVWALFGGLARRIKSDDWDVYAAHRQYQNLIQSAGPAEGRLLQTYSLLQPSIFADFKKVILAGACFKETLLHQLWSAKGVQFRPVEETLSRSLRYQTHGNGALIDIYYASDEEWSKNYRDKPLEDDGNHIQLFDHIVAAVKTEIGSDPLLWLANKDIPDSLFDSALHARLPNTPHGLNNYQDFHNVAIFSALNPPPAHFGFLATQGVDGNAVRTGHYRYAVYQAVVRSSIRNPDDKTPKRVFVMDRSTADWLAKLFPGARVSPLKGVTKAPQKLKGGRRRKHTCDADKTAASRKRKKQELLQGLNALNGLSVAEIDYQRFLGAKDLQAASAAERPDPESRYDCSFKKGRFVTPTHPPFCLPSQTAESQGTVFAHKYAKSPLVDAGGVKAEEEEFITFLRELHARPLPKEKAGLFTPTTFDPDKSKDTNRGLANVEYIRGIWLDNDGGDLSHEDFANLLPHLRIVVWNTASSTALAPRWRAFIPTSCAMTLDVHKVILQQIERILQRAGYWRPKDLENNPRIKSRKLHGFDTSKFNASSLFYLPVQAADPKDSFFVDYDGPHRSELDIYAWIEQCIIDLCPEEEKAAFLAVDRLKNEALRKQLQSLKQHAAGARHGKLSEAQRAERVERYCEDWRRALRGEGHREFFRLAARLYRLGLSTCEVETNLRTELIYANSKDKRRREIPGILKKLPKLGTFKVPTL